MIIEAGLKTLCVAAFALFAVCAIAINPEPVASGQLIVAVNQ